MKKSVYVTRDGSDHVTLVVGFLNSYNTSFQ